MKRRIVLTTGACVAGLVVGVIVGRCSLMGRVALYHDLLSEQRSLLEKHADTLKSWTVLDHREEADACPVHHRPLVLDLVPVSYGLRGIDAELQDARRKQFPYANKESPGGCVVMPWKEALVLYCPACRQAETEWEKGQAGQKKLDRQNSKPQPAHTTNVVSALLSRNVNYTYVALLTLRKNGFSVPEVDIDKPYCQAQPELLKLARMVRQLPRRKQGELDESFRADMMCHSPYFGSPADGWEP